MQFWVSSTGRPVAWGLWHFEQVKLWAFVPAMLIPPMVPVPYQFAKSPPIGVVVFVRMVLYQPLLRRLLQLLSQDHCERGAKG